MSSLSSAPSLAFPRKQVLQLRGHLPGILVCGVVALAATFLSEHHGGPQLLYALLLGLAMHFLAADARIAPGLLFCSRTALRLGVALLGARITLAQVSGLGLATAGGVVVAVALTIGAGLLLARVLGRPTEEGVLTGCAVGICGASAAMAVSAALPPSRENERFTLLTVVGVTLLSTIAMVTYPMGLAALGLDPHHSGIVLGGTIHDVAQVVAAGMIVGPQAADTAAIVKLLRVALLAPVVFVVALVYRQHQASAGDNRSRPPLLPGFLIGFAVLVVLASIGWIPQAATDVATSSSKWLLMLAIAAAGIRTNLGDLATLGWIPVLMMVSETVWIALLTLALVAWT